MAIFSSLIIFLAQISPGSGQTVLENEAVIAILAYFCAFNRVDQS